MNTLLELCFLFLYIYSLLLFKIINIEDQNLFRHRFVLFLLIYPFTFIIYLIDRLVRGCTTDIYTLSLRSIQTALICIIGYSIYFDFNIIELAKNKKDIFAPAISSYLGITITISLLVGVFKIIGLLLYNSDQC